MNERPPLDGLDPVLEHRVRLAVCTLLARTEEISFSRFKELLRQTDGNLGAQLRRLEDAGYVDLRREFTGRRPVTWYRLTRQGGKALKEHIACLHDIING